MLFFEREIVARLKRRLVEQPLFLQLLVGPRQVGKTTAVNQLAQQVSMPSLYSAADSAGVADRSWIESKWAEARALLKEHSRALLILDEVQLVDDWQRSVKSLWDADRLKNLNLHVIVTGSSALLLKRGTESLAGRFEQHTLLQWSFGEMRRAFGFSLEDFIFFGGYPGAATLISDETRWREYIRSSLIETVLSKDILSLVRVDKPSLLRQLFSLICGYPAEIVAYNSFLGQLVDAGNITTLSDYATLLEDSYLVTSLQKYSGSQIRQRASKPKWIIRDNALISALGSLSSMKATSLPLYGRLFENAVIAHLLRILPRGTYWRERDVEVDYVSEVDGEVVAIEIKAGKRTRSKSGLQQFKARYPRARTLLIGGDGISAEAVLGSERWIW